MASGSNWPQVATGGSSVLPARAADPAWSAWDVLYIVMMMFGSLLLSLIVLTILVRRIAFQNVPFMQVMSFPLLQFGAQMSAYVVTLGFMFTTATHKSGTDFGTAVRWNRPRSWGIFLGLGVICAVGLQILAHFLPMPKGNEMEIFFQTPLRAWILSIFAMTFVPLMEELFFRGFLYPVLARRLGLILAVVLTTIAFTAIHMPQLADPHASLATSWGAVLVIFIIGLVLTVVRAIRRSVAACVLIHIGYNGFTAVAAMIQTHGFRHLDKIAR
jgi:membrane protease YdiL (CAAX protease family)